MHEMAIFPLLSRIWCRHCVPPPRFPKRCDNFGNSCTFKADLGLLIFAWIFRISWPKMGILRVKYGKGWCNVDPKWSRLYFLGFLCRANFGENWSRKCNHENVHRWTDRQTDAPMQTSFIICPMLHATADDYEQSQYPCQQNCKHKLIHV